MAGTGEAGRGFRAEAVGLVLFASVVLALVGAFEVVMGLSAVANPDYFVVDDTYLFALSPTAWGWVHLGLGVVLLLAAAGLLRGAGWARGVAVVVAGLTALAAFLSLPYQPWWSLVVISLAVAVVWAVTRHGADVTEVD